MSYRVVLTDQVFPDLETEREILAAIGAEIRIAGQGQDPIELARDADAILNTYFPLPADAIERLEKCRVIARYGIGVDNIDLDAARTAGIRVTNVPDYSIEEVAVHTLLLILASIRRLPLALTRAMAGEWAVSGLRPIPRVSELTIGIVGLGRIGSALSRLVAPLGATMVGFDPIATSGPDRVVLAADLQSLLVASDVVTLHLPVNTETRHMINRTTLGQMKHGAILVNTSRGALIDTDALIETLAAGTLRYASLDVLESEPADVERFAGLPNALITPHMAYYSDSSIAESQRKAATQIVKVLSGLEPDYPVN